MKNQIVGKQRELKIEDREFVFRKEKFKIKFHFLIDTESKEEFTTTELDEINTNQVYNQYREKHNLPFPDEIKKLREKYELPATKMSEILGFGVNTYRNYEDGEVPADANAKLIQLAEDPHVFRKLVRISSLEGAFKKKLIARIDDLINKVEEAELEFKPVLFNENVAYEFSGYRKPSLDRVTEMIVYFTEKLKPWKTQMNKLLFYADFFNFKKSGFSISGMPYRAIDMGPVVADFNVVFDYCATRDHVDVYSTPFDNGGVGEQFKPNKKRKFNKSMFEPAELEILDSVVQKFGSMKTKQLVDYSHNEKGWKQNQKTHELISYKYAFDIQ